MEKPTELTKREKDIAYEGFMVGRIYNKMGEPEKPSEILPKLYEKCLREANMKSKPTEDKYV